MPLKTMLLLLTVGAVGYLIARPYSTATRDIADTPSPYVPVIADVLHEHEGEDTPMVHAFEAALEHATHA